MKPENFKNEINTIKQIALAYGYTCKMVEDILKGKQYKMAISLVYPKQPKEIISYYSLLHLSNISNKISKIVSNSTLHNVAFHTTNNVGSILCNAKEKSNKNPVSKGLTVLIVMLSMWKKQ